MAAFEGFPAGKLAQSDLPSLFFQQILAQVDDLAELKVILFALWYLGQQESKTAAIAYETFSNDRLLLQSLGDAPQTALDAALAKAVVRGVLLEQDAGPTSENPTLPAGTFYFLNAPEGRAAARAVQEGRWHPLMKSPAPVELALERPNIYTLYEENIGPLTPLIAEDLREAEQTYRADWVEEAIHIAVKNNVRRWRYVEAILRGWQEEGRHEEDRGASEKDYLRYIQGKYGELGEY
jgi:DnaD/phage-associated family protein